MSFGFSVGDFIAAAQLAHTLYKDVYRVARNAPEEICVLIAEMGILSKSIDWLVEEVQAPDSTLARSGKERVGLVIDVVRRTKLTLDDLDLFAQRHDFRAKSADRAKIKRLWDRIKYAQESSSVKELRARIQYHNGIISLLLTAAGNSSLERIETSSRAMLSDIGGIKDMLANSPEAPVLSMIENEKIFQISLSQAFMREAERVRPWLAVGFDDWVQAGKWWLIKSQVTLYINASTDLVIPPQAYADLLKASWILIDILSNPQLKRSPTSEFYQVRMLAEMIQNVREVERMHLIKPGLALIEQADLTIWFGIYAPAEKATNSDCMVLVLVNDSIESAHLVIQTQSGIDICDINVLEVVVDQRISFAKENNPNFGKQCVGHQSYNGLKVYGGYLYFTTRDELAYFVQILRGIRGYLKVKHNLKDHKFLFSMILLIAASSGQKACITSAIRLGRSTYQINPEQDYTCFSTFTDIWQLAVAVATLSLQAKETDLLLDQNIDDQDCSKSDSLLAMLGENDWLYPIFKTVSSLVHSCWKSAFRQLNLGLIQKGHEISLVTYQAFFLACRNGDEDVMYALLKGELEINRAFLFEHHSTDDPESTTALFQAVQGVGRKAVVQILLEKGAEINAAMDDGETPLHSAVRFGDTEVVALLLGKGADIQAKTKSGETPLHNAVKLRQKEIAVLLLRKGADAKVPLCDAIENGEREIVGLFLEIGADLCIFGKYLVIIAGYMFAFREIRARTRNKALAGFLAEEVGTDHNDMVDFVCRVTPRIGDKGRLRSKILRREWCWPRGEAEFPWNS